MKIKAAIIGGAGYTAGELIRILLNHPEVEISSIQSKSHSGKYIFVAHPDLEGDTELRFDANLNPDADIVFICSGHGNSKQAIEENKLPKELKIIDLSSDFRLKDSSHNFVYGLPELNRDEIKKADHIANPGCFATCIQLGLLPLAKNDLLKQDIHVSAITGSTGAGQNPTDTTHFSWRSNNASIYKPFTHQHLAEIRQSLEQLQSGFSSPVHFIPMRGAFTRGIFAASYTNTDLLLEDAAELYHDYYSGHPFVHIAETAPEVKRVVNTNKALIHLQKNDGRLLVTAVIDNLLKGASGQAVQNMNLLFGLDETTGLNLKPSAF